MSVVLDSLRTNSAVSLELAISRMTFASGSEGLLAKALKCASSTSSFSAATPTSRALLRRNTSISAGGQENDDDEVEAAFARDSAGEGLF